ncbi:hypothetical protein [Burkholderia cenocepacia]|uniref:hypothetical protein n=1 Tax=Burkholderia cenocepacia TaxID=95486 RepID=UPI0028587274|nr:hypothetical protein [Burkholderia cenocepacia]MDR8052480.1 hypothetical protein [Burkholderia cenocepacia]
MKLLKALIVGFLVLGVMYVFLAKVLVNSPTDTAEKYRKMKSDMDWIVGRGGMVVFSKDNERGSAVLIMRSIDAQSVNERLLSVYRGAFISRGWDVVDSNEKEISFCKDGGHATLSLVPEWFPERRIDIYGLSMEYNSGTVMNCR